MFSNDAYFKNGISFAIKISIQKHVFLTYKNIFILNKIAIQKYLPQIFEYLDRKSGIKSYQFNACFLFLTTQVYCFTLNIEDHVIYFSFKMYHQSKSPTLLYLSKN